MNVPGPAQYTVEPISHPGSGLSGSSFDQSASDRVAGQFDPVMHAQFLQQIRSVSLHRLLADHQFLGDLTRTEPLGDELDHLGLPLGQARRIRAGILERCRVAEVFAHKGALGAG